MKNKSNMVYALLLLVVISVVIFMAYLFIGTYNNIPLSSLAPMVPKVASVKVPSTPLPPSTPLTTMQPSVQKFIMQKGEVLYVIQGKFVTAPAYNVNHVLQGLFVIDHDPYNHKIQVSMASKTGKITMSTSEGSFNGQTVVSLQDIDTMQKSIKINAPVQLRYSVGPSKTTSNLSMQAVLDGIIGGSWVIPNGFVLSPSIVGIVK